MSRGHYKIHFFHMRVHSTKMSTRSEMLFCFTLFIIISSCRALFFPSPSSQTGVDGVNKASRWNIPWLGVGLYCNGCPARSCEDDEAIIHGYCCGCAYTMDKLPVICPDFLQCPLNLHGLCHDYEYMIRCCC